MGPFNTSPILVQVAEIEMEEARRRMEANSLEQQQLLVRQGEQASEIDELKKQVAELVQSTATNSPSGITLSLRDHESTDYAVTDFITNATEDSTNGRVGGSNFVETGHAAEDRNHDFGIHSPMENEYDYGFSEIIDFFLTNLTTFFNLFNKVEISFFKLNSFSMFNSTPAYNIIEDSLFKYTVAKNVIMVELTHLIFLFLVAGFISNTIA